MFLKERIKSILDKLPYLKAIREENRILHRELDRFYRNCAFPPGHFYSVLVSVDDIKQREQEVWQDRPPDTIGGIDLRSDDQLMLMGHFPRFYHEMPFTHEQGPHTRYFFDNDYYSYTDAILLYSLIRHQSPARIIEVGSGFSSAVMLDTNELFFNHQIELTFIEPYPERLYSLFRESDRKTTTVFEKDVQSIPAEQFQKLEAGDILFIDSTHVVKTGSDVNYLLFDILPLLKSGVLIHFHDVFYPFEYPKNWVLEGRNWNEDYFLRAFLMYNSGFEIRLFNRYLHQFHPSVFAAMPLCYQNHGSSLWLEKK